ncbi:alpha/beta hydrolase [Saccharopolyspora sp. K220]|uniref:alpha/beta fold hydrolase n=1 Tax=Saccharopolyspora soli TaxID=2926618 RepID=UPI001F59ACB1|nr:alpha/beta hydrolase [Saccharopolyspora soli]MCI2419105.1 alpha/beta hydrolase [Saccharopolyspora soli]
MQDQMPDRPSGAPPLGQYYEVGGRRLPLHRAGNGSPAVVLLPGAGGVGLDYWNVWEKAAELTTSVVYDRTGTGWSDRVDAPLTCAEVTDELRGLLRAADVPAPYLLVGHSLGGLYARLYATRFPGEVAGLVLMDTDHEDYDAYMPRQLTEMRGAWDPDQELPDELPEEAVELYRGLFAQMMADWPEEIREPLVERHVSPEWIMDGYRLVPHRDRFLDEMRQAGPLPDVPLIVLTAMDIDDFKKAVLIGESESLLREEIEGKRRLHDALAASVPRGENRLVDGAGHASIHWRRPDAVLQAIRDLLGR